MAPIVSRIWMHCAEKPHCGVCGVPFMKRTISFCSTTWAIFCRVDSSMPLEMGHFPTRVNRTGRRNPGSGGIRRRMVSAEDSSQGQFDPKGGWAKAMGLEFVRLTADEVVVEWTVGPEHLQPHGIVHGGVHCGVVETVCSVGASLTPPRADAWSASRITRASSAPCVPAASRRPGPPCSAAASAQLWEARIVDEQDRLVATGPRPAPLPREGRRARRKKGDLSAAGSPVSPRNARRPQSWPVTMGCPRAAATDCAEARARFAARAPRPQARAVARPRFAAGSDDGFAIAELGARGGATLESKYVHVLARGQSMRPVSSASAQVRKQTRLFAGFRAGSRSRSRDLR